MMGRHCHVPKQTHHIQFAQLAQSPAVCGLSESAANLRYKLLLICHRVGIKIPRQKKIPTTYNEQAGIWDFNISCTIMFSIQDIYIKHSIRRNKWYIKGNILIISYIYIYKYTLGFYLQVPKRGHWNKDVVFQMWYILFHTFSLRVVMFLASR